MAIIGGLPQAGVQSQGVAYTVIGIYYDILGCKQRSLGAYWCHRLKLIIAIFHGTNWSQGSTTASPCLRVHLRAQPDICLVSLSGRHPETNAMTCALQFLYRSKMVQVSVILVAQPRHCWGIGTLQVLLCDEPTSGLDSAAASNMVVGLSGVDLVSKRGSKQAKMCEHRLVMTVVYIVINAKFVASTGGTTCPISVVWVGMHLMDPYSILAWRYDSIPTHHPGPKQ